MKTEKLGGVARGEGECGDDVAGWLVRERRSLDILPVTPHRQHCVVVSGGRCELGITRYTPECLYIVLQSAEYNICNATRRNLADGAVDRPIQ